MTLIDWFSLIESQPSPGRQLSSPKITAKKCVRLKPAKSCRCTISRGTARNTPGSPQMNPQNATAMRTTNGPTFNVFPKIVGVLN